MISKTKGCSHLKDPHQQSWKQFNWKYMVYIDVYKNAYSRFGPHHFYSIISNLIIKAVPGIEAKDKKTPQHKGTYGLKLINLLRPGGSKHFSLCVESFFSFSSIRGFVCTRRPTIAIGVGLFCLKDVFTICYILGITHTMVWISLHGFPQGDRYSPSPSDVLDPRCVLLVTGDILPSLLHAHGNT